MVAVVTEPLAILAINHTFPGVPSSISGTTLHKDLVEIRGVFHEPYLYAWGQRPSCGSKPVDQVLVRRSVAEKVARPCANCYREDG